MIFFLISFNIENSACLLWFINLSHLLSTRERQSIIHADDMILHNTNLKE